MNTHSSFLQILTLFSHLLLGFIISAQSVMAQVTDEVDEEKKPLKHYDIEIILFKNLKVPKAKEKILPTQAPLLDEKFISFANTDDIEIAAELGFILPEENEFRLLETVNKIEKSSRYKLLSHMVWRQPGLATEDALSIQIRTGEMFSNEYSSIDNPVKPFPVIEDDEDTFKKLDLTKNNIDEPVEIEKVWYELEGKITITLARYLHTYVDLVLRIPSENKIQFSHNIETPDQIELQKELSINSSILNNFAFKEHRRMRSRKLHFLDHPEVGMLILITPYEEPEKIEFIEDDLSL